MKMLVLTLIAFSAHAQLTAVDGGAAAMDANGLEWANTLGVDVTWATTQPYGGGNTAQLWLANLNANRYDGYSDWTLATGDYTTAANPLTNQLGQLFYGDCGNVAGQRNTSLSNVGKPCGALSALVAEMNNPQKFGAYGPLIFSGTGYRCCDIYQTYWGTYGTYGSWQGAWNFDASTPYASVGLGDAMAVRKMTEAPEIDPASMTTALTLLVGSLLVLRGRIHCGKRGIA